MVPRIAMMKALHRHEPKAEAAPGRKRAKVYKIAELIVMSAVRHGRRLAALTE
jgi:hypothetical protein